MKDKFIELIKNEFRIEDLESQLVGLSEKDLKDFLLFSMNEFEKITVEGWLKIIEAYHDTGFVYLYESGFDKDYFGRMGFYIEDIDTTQTSSYLIAENHLNNFINQCNRILKYRIVNPIETKTDKLKTMLSEHGFFELTKVKQLSEQNKQSLIELISTADLPYSIAMLDYLAFLKHLKAEHFKSDTKLFKVVSEWFEVGQRRVKGNIYVLNEISKENRKRYTADQHKQTVQNDYEALK
jgi:hypothetical protein